MLCTNPLTGGAAAEAGVEANLGTLKPSDDMKTGGLVKAAIPARCDQRGFLLIGDPPEMGPYVLPGNNYHVYDITLFWANVRADALRRLATYEGKPSPVPPAAAVKPPAASAPLPSSPRT